MRWDQFLDTADRLARGTTEGDWRSAISRSYYAVFHYFREFFRGGGLDVGRGSGAAHFNLYSGLLNCGFPAVAKLGSRLDRLRDARTDADYELPLRITQTQATDSVVEAKAIVTTFQALLTTILATQIVDGARKHLRAIGRIA